MIWSLLGVTTYSTAPPLLHLLVRTYSAYHTYHTLPYLTLPYLTYIRPIHPSSLASILFLSAANLPSIFSSSCLCRRLVPLCITLLFLHPIHDILSQPRRKALCLSKPTPLHHHHHRRPTDRPSDEEANSWTRIYTPTHHKLSPHPPRPHLGSARALRPPHSTTSYQHTFHRTTWLPT